DERSISFRVASEKARATYNFAPSLCFYVPCATARILNRFYNTGRFDLSDINVHNGVEHDA
ncbi:aromatic peroxygenase, partial [Lactifluus volemus]